MFGKDKFKNSKLWDVARVIQDKKMPGHVRIQRIFQFVGKADRDGVGGTKLAAKKYSRDEDMVRRVLAVMAIVSSKTPLAVFSNVDLKNYVASLDPKHKLPHHLETNRIIECMIDYAAAEMTRIIAERRKDLTSGFLSVSTDFVTDPSRKESFGVILLDIIAFKYRLNDGRTLFMSKETAKRVKEVLASVCIS